MNFKAPRGTHDLWAAQAEKISFLEEVSRRIFRRYNIAEIRVPSFEDAGLFTRSIGETTDIVEKEMYVFEDRKGRKLALRPEGTASVVRACIEHQLIQNLPVAKLFYMGSMFRYERPQAGRYREFFQVGAEYFGNAAPTADAEIILLARDILTGVGLGDIRVHINSLGCAACRPVFRAALTEYFAKQQDLCGDCQRRIERNPLRLLDCKVDGPRFTDVPRMCDSLCPECATHFNRVQEFLTAAGASFQIDHRLVRGLDYYTRTIFEIRSAGLGAQDTLAAGGRYDNLVKELGGSPTPAVGFALGSERVVMAADNLGRLKLEVRPTVFIAVAGAELEPEAVKLAAALRNRAATVSGIDPAADLQVEGPYADKSLKSQLRLADKVGAARTIIFGADEFKRGTVTVRDMKTQQQEEVPITSFTA